MLPNHAAESIGDLLRMLGARRLWCLLWLRCLIGQAQSFLHDALAIVAALLESLQALTPDRSANPEPALWGAGGALAAALVAELFIQRHLAAVLTGVTAALAWQSYGEQPSR
jgi:hypothetical protein